MDFNLFEAQDPERLLLNFQFIPNPTFNLNLKGVPFVGAITNPEKINSFQWETVCVAYDPQVQNVTLVFRGVTVFKVNFICTCFIQLM